VKLRSHGTFASMCLIVVSVFTAHNIQAQSLADRFHATYHALQSVRCTFTLDGQHTGELFAVRGKGYILTLADRKIICDGKTVWNVTPSTKTAVINSVTINGDDMNLERLFFSLMSIYHASPVKGAPNELDLIPPSISMRVAGVASARVTVDSKMRVTKVVTNDGTATAVWTMKSLQLNAPQSAAQRFTFDPPSGWTTIDLR
jgi:outer membrane lipoprotein-sorting protein